jgi:hypothetical protein
MRQVNPNQARKGTFLKSFDIGNFKEMLDYCGDTERAMGRNEIRGEIVYTKIFSKKGDTWQVFLVRK